MTRKFTSLFLNKSLDKKGETLVEALIAILIIAIASVVLLSAILNASEIDKQVRVSDEKYSREVVATEAYDNKLGSSTVSVYPVNATGGRTDEEPTEYKINYYGSDDGTLRAFQRATN